MRGGRKICILRPGRGILARAGDAREKILMVSKNRLTGNFKKKEKEHSHGQKEEQWKMIAKEEHRENIKFLLGGLPQF